MSPSHNDRDNAELEREMSIQRRIAFAAGLFQQDVTVRTLLESVAEGVVIVDSGSIILLVNERAETMFGYSKDELIGKPHSILVPEASRERHEKEQAGYLAAPVTRPMGQLLDLVGLRKDGTEFPLQISLGYIQTLHGILIISLIADITARKEAEKALKQTEELFRIQVSCVRDYAIYLLDPQGRVMSWNAGAEALKGYCAEEIIGRHFSCLYPREDQLAGMPDELLRKAAAEGRVETEGWRVRKDGSMFWADIVITALRDETGNVRGFSKVTRDTTERKRAEDALRVSEARYRALFIDNPTMVVTIDQDMKTLSVNPACARQLGYSLEELTGQNVLKLFHEADREGVAERISACFKNPNQVFSWHFRKVRKNGNVLWVEETAQAVYDLDQRLNVLIVCQDVTEREELLLQLEAVLDSINEAVVIAGLDGNMVKLNKAALRLTGYASQERAQGPYEELRHSFEVQDLEGRPLPLDRWPLARAIAGESFLDLEVRLHQKEKGRTLILSISGGPVCNKAGDAILAVITARDITERKRIEEQLRIANAQLQIVTDNISIGVTRCSLDHRYLWVSSAYAGWLGLRPEDIVGRRIFEVLGEEAYECVKPHIEQVLRGHKVEFEARMNVTHLGVRWIEGRYMPTCSPTGDPDGWVEVAWDITGRKDLEQELHQAKDLLEQRVAERTAELTAALNTLQLETRQRLQTVEELRDTEQMLIHQGRMAAMGEMIGFIAHQWRQPLNTLGLIVQELPVYFRRGAITQEYLDASAYKARELISHMSRTIDDFRNFFRSEKHKVPFRIKDQLEKVLMLVEATLKDKQTVVEVSIEEDVEIEGSPNEFSQVLLNILVNINDAFTERNIPQPWIKIRLFRENGASVITVADNAGGIPEGIIGKIFDAYFTTKGPDKGTGLGLYMAKTIIEKNMGGRISARNTGEGAEFRIEV